MNGETTNPGIKLSNVPVMEDQCRRRTGEIMVLQQETLKAIQDIGTKLDIHIATDEAVKQTKSTGRKAGSYYVSVIGLAVIVAALVAETAWLLASRL